MFLGNKIVDIIVKILHLKLSDNNRHLLIQIVNFAFVGFVATVIDFVFLYVFRDVCKLSLIVSNTLSFCISVIYNYIASVTFVFDVDKNKSKKKSFLLFIIFSVMGLIINDIIVYGATVWFRLYYLLSKIVATLFVMIFNFVTRKKFLE